MRPFIYILTAITFLFFSCAPSDKAQPDVGNYYVSVVTGLITAKQHQDQFLNKCASIINDISDNKQAQVDTAELRILMENAKTSGTGAIDALSNIVEVDTTINLKSKSIDYLNTANNSYDSSFSKWIALVGDSKGNKTSMTLEVLYVETKKLSTKRKVLEEAQKSFKEKHNIQLF